MTPQIDTSDTTTCGTRTCASRGRSSSDRVSVRLIGDLFNLMNANTVLIRNNNIASAPTVFNQITQNLSPRIFRVGLAVGF